MIKEAVEAQRKYCNKNGFPNFAPQDGYCYFCNRIIYANRFERGYSIEYAATHLITGCPHCHGSYCD